VIPNNLHANKNSDKIKASEVFKRALKPPLRDSRFWAVQFTVLLITLIHYYLDVTKVFTGSPWSSIPVFVLLLPVGYAAIKYGLHGSAATSVWSTVLWIPDLYVSSDRDARAFGAIAIVVVNAVGIIIGERIERELLAIAKAKAAQEQQRISEARFRHLFASTRAPILLFDEHGKVVNANPAAWGVFKNKVLDLTFADICNMSITGVFKGKNPTNIQLDIDGQTVEFRCLISLVKENDIYVTQLLLQDITEERRAFKDVKAFASSLLDAQEDERLRIARELHDDPLQAVIHSSRQIDSILIDKEFQLPGNQRTVLTKTREELLKTARSIRSIAQGLRPPSLEHLGLSAAIKGLIADLEPEFGSSIKFVQKGEEKRLKLEVELAMYRICQESLQNAISHAKANSIEVELAFQESTVFLKVSDNGVGFDSVSNIDDKRLGLRGIRERVSLLGGNFTISTKESSGTTLTVLIPTDIYSK
jgi:signal transduction histidine kinase